MELPNQILPEPEIIEDEDIGKGIVSRVILFNDEWHTFEEVIVQIIKAIHCSFEVARDKTFEVHVKGKSIIFSGALDMCLKVSSVLEEIALHTQIET
jgi:ATP-dependent Clp protease adapter protein ClpS